MDKHFTERGDLPPLLVDTSALYGSSAAIKVAEGYETKDYGTQKSHLRAWALNQLYSL